MDEQHIINAARTRFDALLHNPEYKKLLADDSHLQTLMDLCPLAPGRVYLDLGTGSGYIAFALARRMNSITVRGLDIARAAIEKDNELARAAGLDNIAFDRFDGDAFPYHEALFHGVVSRYAFHHFPNPAASFMEISRVTAADGFFLFSDPTPAPGDREDFINRFQSLRPDGHVRYYPREEIRSLARRAGFTVAAENTNSIRYPRIMNQDYKRLIHSTDKEILDLYALGFEANKVFLTVEVMNILFTKNAQASATEKKGKV